MRQALYLRIRSDPAPEESAQLESEGYVVLRDVFTGGEVAALRADVDRVYEEVPPDVRGAQYAAEHWAPFRYEMLNRSAVCQKAIAHPAILDVVEPLPARTATSSPTPCGVSHPRRTATVAASGT
jgi:hypothetical protein